MSEITVVIIIAIGAGIVKGLWEYHKDKKDTELGNCLLKGGMN